MKKKRINMKSVVLILLLSLVTLFKSSTGLKCYSCGWWSKNCGDPFVKDDSLLVECNTRAINDFNQGLGNAINTANNALQNFANQVGFNFNQNNLNLPTINEDSVGCIKVVLKNGEDTFRVARGCIYNKGNSCKSMQIFDDEFKSLKYCNSCDDNGCNGARSSVKSSVGAIIFTIVVMYLFHGLR